MKFTVVLPALPGYTSDNGTVGQLQAWRKRIGEAIEPGETIAVVGEAEISCATWGILHKKMVLPGEAIEVGEPLAVLSGVSAPLFTGREAVPEPFPATPTVQGPETRVALSAPQQSLARHDVQSFHAPHVFTGARVDVSEALRLSQKTDGLFVAFVVAAVAAILPRFPDLNGYLASPSEMRRRLYLHIAVAHSLPNGETVAPVLRNANDKSPLTLSRELARLRDRAQTSALSRAEQQGATFTLRETGSGAIWQTAILHQPQTALLTVGPPQREAIVLESGAIEAHPVSHLCLIHDARTVRPEVAADFLGHVKTYLEEARFLFG